MELFLIVGGGVSTA